MANIKMIIDVSPNLVLTFALECDFMMKFVYKVKYFIEFCFNGGFHG